MEAVATTINKCIPTVVRSQVAPLEMVQAQTMKTPCQTKETKSTSTAAKPVQPMKPFPTPTPMVRRNREINKGKILPNAKAKPNRYQMINPTIKSVRFCFQAGVKYLEEDVVDTFSSDRTSFEHEKASLHN